MDKTLGGEGGGPKDSPGLNTVKIMQHMFSIYFVCPIFIPVNISMSFNNICDANFHIRVILRRIFGASDVRFTPIAHIMQLGKL